MESGKYYRRKGWKNEKKNNHYGKNETIKYLHAVAVDKDELVYIVVDWQWSVYYKVGVPHVVITEHRHTNSYGFSFESLNADDWEEIELTEEFALKGNQEVPEYSTEVEYKTQSYPRWLNQERAVIR